MKPFKEKVKEHRGQLGLSQKQLAEKAGIGFRTIVTYEAGERFPQSAQLYKLAKALNVSKQSVSNWENDNIQPSIDMLIKLSKVLSVSTDCLLGLDGEKYIKVEGLTAEQIAHIQQIIEDIKK